MLWFDLLPVSRATELAVPWRSALGDAYDIGRLGIVVNMESGRWREPGSPCPINAARIDLDMCASCRYFRGASSGRRIHCNWPRHGSTIAAPSPSIGSREDRPSVPPSFRRAFGAGGDHGDDAAA